MTRYTARQIYTFAVEAGFTPDQAVTMTAIALAESGGRADAHNPRGEDSRGLWQINVQAHPQFAQQDLYDPRENARAAYQVSSRGTDVSPWTVTHRGPEARYLRFRKEAQAAGDSPGLGVWTGTPGYGRRLSAGN